MKKSTIKIEDLDYNIRNIKDYNIKILDITNMQKFLSFPINDYITEETKKINDENDNIYFYCSFFMNPYIEKILINVSFAKSYSKIIDIGGNNTYLFPLSNALLNVNDDVLQNNIKHYNYDLDFDKFEAIEDNEFDFGFCRHTLEDIQNPQNAFREIIRICKSGYIETPSPIVEITKLFFKREDTSDMMFSKNKVNRGFIHHRYFVWTDISTNTLYFLPKYPCIETMDFSNEGMIKIKKILNDYSVYWNNYYFFTSEDENPPNIFVYRNDINFSIQSKDDSENEYLTLLNTAFIKSIEATNYFIEKYKVLL